MQDDKGSLSKLDLSKNNLRSEGLSVVSETLKSTSIKQLNIAGSMVTYNTQDDEDMSGVIKFTGDMKDMGSLSSLDLSNNNLGVGVSDDGWTHDPNGYWKYTHKNGKKQDGPPKGVIFRQVGVIALANAIQDMGSLVSLNLAQNWLGVEGAKHVAEVLPKW